jgi:hypothetical protein
MVRKWGPPSLAMGGLLALLATIAGYGAPSFDIGVARFAHVLESLLAAGVIGGLWIAAALGYGRLWRRTFRDGAHRWSPQFGLGVATLLFLDHGTAQVGLLASDWVAWGLLAVGFALLIDQVRSRPNRPEQWESLPLSVVLGVPGVAMMLVAAAALPGWLWVSEANGYDVLEYHLQLPAEWLRLGRLTTLDHNVYSALPNYVEAAYLHLMSCFGGPWAGGGLPLRAAQYLHVGVTIAAMIMVGRLIMRYVAPIEGRVSTAFAAGIVTSILLLTPWVIVTATMAYNESFVLVLFVTAALVVGDRHLSLSRRGLLAGVLVGAASMAKLPAAFMVGGPIAILFVIEVLALTGARWRGGVIAAATGIGATFFMAAPWLIRNGLATGNPLFPFATGIFGTGHWSAEQAARWSAAHHFEGDTTARLAAMWERGVAHPQWSLVFAFILLAAICALVHRPTRRAAAVCIGALVVQGATWALLTHIQARFLLPVVLPGGVLMALALAPIGRIGSTRWRRIGVVFACLLPLAPAVHAVITYHRQPLIRFSLYLARDAIRFRTGALYQSDPGLRTPGDVPLEYYTNFVLPPDAVVLLVGGATPLYHAPTVSLRHNLGPLSARGPDRFTSE